MRHLPTIWGDFDRPFAMNGTWRALLQQLDDFMNDTTAGLRADGGNTFSPALDLAETDQHYVLNFDMPGIDKEHIDISVHGNQLTVSGERKFERDQGEGKSRFIERRYGKFQRSLTLPEGIRSEQIEAQYHNGVLSIAVPKAAAIERQKVKIADHQSGFFSKILGHGAKKDKDAVSVKANDRTEGVAAH